MAVHALLRKSMTCACFVLLTGLPSRMVWDAVASTSKDADGPCLREIQTEITPGRVRLVLTGTAGAAFTVKQFRYPAFRTVAAGKKASSTTAGEMVFFFPDLAVGPNVPAEKALDSALVPVIHAVTVKRPRQGARVGVVLGRNAAAKVLQSAPQGDLVIEVTPRDAVTNSFAPIPSHGPVRRISLDFADADLLDAVKALGAQSGEAIALTASASGTVTLRVKDTDFEQALRLVAGLNGLSVLHKNGLWVVGKPAELQALFPGAMVVHAYSARYLPVSDLAAVLQTTFPAVGVIASEERRTLTLTGEPETVEQALQSLRGTDTPAMAGRPVPQVAIDIAAVALPTAAIKSLSIAWEPGDAAAGSALAVGTWRGGWESFAAAVAQLAGRGNACILAQPRVTTLSGKPAMVWIGDSVPVDSRRGLATGDDPGAPSAGIRVSCLPTLTADGSITVDLEPALSALTTGAAGQEPLVSLRKLHMTMRLRDGDIVVFGSTWPGDVRFAGPDPLFSRLPMLAGSNRSAQQDREPVEVLLAIGLHVVAS